LKLLENWAREEMHEDDARLLAEQAERTRESFNKNFWYEAGGYLYDLIDTEIVKDGKDAALRPNQLLSFSLSYPVLEQHRWKSVLDVVQQHLWTPYGLRSLAPFDPSFKAQYYGDLRSRDAAYHQGTVWAWLTGPFIDAWLKVHPDDRVEARRLLDGFRDHLGDACIGSISEIFDASEPFLSRGCVAQAWSVAEVLRCWVKTAPEQSAS
jgi:glycogen debranching enzyme